MTNTQSSPLTSRLGRFGAAVGVALTVVAGCADGGQEVPRSDTAPVDVSPEASLPPTETIVIEGLDTCDPVENMTFEVSFEGDDAFSFGTPEEAREGMLVDNVPPPGEFLEKSVSSGRVVWDLVTDGGIVIGNLSARLTESGWVLDTGEWCAP